MNDFPLFKNDAGINQAQSTRGDILLYLISHLAQGRAPAGLTPTPWTQYIRFLPRPVPVPTMWSCGEKQLLNGTSLEVGDAVESFHG